MAALGLNFKKKLSGQIIGYDPGGNDNHGLTVIEFKNSHIDSIHIATYSHVEALLEHVLQLSNPIAIGVDTYTCWCSDYSGWRPADLWLKKQYPEIRPSVASPNSLYGSMSINGMGLLVELRQQFGDIVISETHPKVIFYALTGQKYAYLKKRPFMEQLLTQRFSQSVVTNNEHEWDAAIAAYSVWQGISGNWTQNLHQLPLKENTRLIHPAGKNFFFWPEVSSHV